MRRLQVYNYQRNLTDTPAAKVFIIRQSSPLDEFNTEVMVHGKKKVTHITSDLRIFFNQQRLATLDPAYINQLVAQIRSRPAFGEDIPDDILIGAIKSRYIQSNADMHHYSLMLSDQTSEEYQRILDQIEVEKQLQQSASDGNSE